MPKLGPDLSSLERKYNAPDWYMLRLKAFRVKKNKAGDSYNLNPQFEILGGLPGYDTALFDTMSLKFPQSTLDIVHGLGFSLEADGSIPGEFKADPSDPDNCEKWRYEGPLLGKEMRGELMLNTYGTNPVGLKLRQVQCKVTGCVKKHSTNLQGGNKD